MLAVPVDRRCEHPLTSTRAHGFCKLEAVGTFDIPPTYVPPTRTKVALPLPARMRLCPTHKRLLDAFITGVGRSDIAQSHETQCKVCNHPDHKRLEKLWLEWVLDTGEVMAALNSNPDRPISHMSWHRHVQYFGLLDKKAAKVNTKRALVIAAEKGFGAGGHSVRTALIALQQLGKERGDVEEVKHTVTGVIGTVDLTKLTDKQLAEMASKLAVELQSGDQERRALGDGASQTIDLPKSAVRTRRED